MILLDVGQHLLVGVGLCLSFCDAWLIACFEVHTLPSNWILRAKAYALRLPSRYEPEVWVECPHGTAPPDIQASLEACDVPKLDNLEPGFRGARAQGRNVE